MRRSGRGSRTAHAAQLEYLGTEATVVGSAHPPFVGLSGTVVDETKNTFVLDTAAGRIRVPKEGQRFAFRRADGSAVEVDGRDVAHRPEDRIKKARTRGLPRQSGGPADGESR